MAMIPTSIEQRNFFCHPRHGWLAKHRAFLQSQRVLEIVFNELSAAEMSKMGTMEQLELLDQFHVQKSDLENLDGEKFGLIERDGKKLYRFRTQDWR